MIRGEAPPIVAIASESAPAVEPTAAPRASAYAALGPQHRPPRSRALQTPGTRIGAGTRIAAAPAEAIPASGPTGARSTQIPKRDHEHPSAATPRKCPRATRGDGRLELNNDAHDPARLRPQRALPTRLPPRRVHANRGQSRVAEVDHRACRVIEHEEFLGGAVRQIQRDLRGPGRRGQVDATQLRARPPPMRCPPQRPGRRRLQSERPFLSWSSRSNLLRNLRLGREFFNWHRRARLADVAPPRSSDLSPHGYADSLRAGDLPPDAHADSLRSRGLPPDGHADSLRSRDVRRRRLSPPMAYTPVACVARPSQTSPRGVPAVTSMSCPASPAVSVTTRSASGSRAAPRSGHSMSQR